MLNLPRSVFMIYAIIARPMVLLSCLEKIQNAIRVLKNRAIHGQKLAVRN